MVERSDWQKFGPQWFKKTLEDKLLEDAPDWLKGLVKDEPEQDFEQAVEQHRNRETEQGDFEERLKGFLRSREAGRWGYNAWFARGTDRIQAPPKEPTQMTFNEILDWQRAVRNSGGESTAIGGYQIIYKTMLDAKRKLGLSGDELFDEELQDRIASDYLLRIKRSQQNQPTIDDYVTGKVDKEIFANSIATEWASMPVLTETKRGSVTIKPGQSYYKGVGSNKALSGVEEYSKILELANTSIDEDEKETS